MKENYAFCLDFKVRDYECDMQGVVNNATYMNYLEHTRHEYLLENNFSFAELTAKKINLMVVSAELQYKKSLISGDDFWVGLNFEAASKVRLRFVQNIYRNNDIILKANIIVTSVNERGRPYFPKELAPLLSKV